MLPKGALKLDLNNGLDPVLMPLWATLEYEDEPEFIFRSSADRRNWWGTRGGNWSIEGAGQGSGVEIALWRVTAQLEGQTRDSAWYYFLFVGRKANKPGRAN